MAVLASDLLSLVLNKKLSKQMISVLDTLRKLPIGISKKPPEYFELMVSFQFLDRIHGVVVGFSLHETENFSKKYIGSYKSRTNNPVPLS